MTELPATFGKYFLTEKLATGGMAEIYLGKIVGPGGFEKQLVIKQIHPRLAAEPHFVDLFVAEAKTLVGLTHGNIVPVYELGIVDDTYFIAMEYIDGPTLWRFTEAAWDQDDLLSPAIGAWIAAEILDGLDYAHRKGEGVIHRDLSPRNVMLSRDGQVLLVDFGIAVPFGTGEESADGAPTGSFPYMSPEQVERKRLTTASDLFSVSILLWELLAGRRLFARPGADATLDAVLHAEIAPPSTFRPEVSAKLDEVVLRGLQRDVDARWGSAGEYLAALNRYLYTLEAPPTARDLTTLVARYCPPVVATTGADGEADADPPQTETREVGPGGTVVVPRKSAERAAPPSDDANQTAVKVREHSFATHVEIERVLGATPLFPLRAIRDELPMPEDPAASASMPALETPAPLPVVAPAAGISLATWLPPALLAVILAAIGVLLLLRPGAPARSASPDATRLAATHDARPIDARPATPDATPIVDAATAAVDAPLPTIDAARPPKDGGVRPPPRDAGTSPKIDAAPPKIDAALATGTVKVGADPWGEVSIDGTKRGNAPGEWTVTVGKHEVVVTHPGADREQRQTFHVDVSAGEIESVFAEFGP